MVCYEDFLYHKKLYRSGHCPSFITHILLINSSNLRNVISGYLFNNDPVRWCKHGKVRHA
jgi:hypothetical protein